MIRLQENIEVPRAIDDVSAYTSNFTNAEQWDPGVAESARTGQGPIGIGTAFKLRVKFGPRSIPTIEGAQEAPHTLGDQRCLADGPAQARLRLRISFSTEITGRMIAPASALTRSDWAVSGKVEKIACMGGA